MVSEGDSLNTNIKAVNDSVFVQGEENTFEVEFEIDNWDALIDKYSSESHLIKALVFNNDDELIYVDNEIAPYSNGTIIWDGTYEDEDGETRTIDKEGAPYEFVVMAFCGDDPEVLKDEFSCGFWGIRSCTMKEFLYNEEETRQKLRDETGDSVLVVFSHDGFTLEYQERNATERMLSDIKDANINGDENLDITEYYEKVSSDPAYETTVDINDNQVDLMVIHTLMWEGDRTLYPLSENVSGYDTDGTYKKGIKFEGDGINNNDNSNTLLELRTKTSEKMDKLEEYLFLKTFDTETIDTESQDVIDEMEEDTQLDTIATCNLCIRQALRRIANDEVLYPIHMNNYSGKISAIGKANDIYCDFLRWYHSEEYNIIKSSYVDPLLEDNLDIAREWDEDRYANSTAEDFRSELEITEFKKVEETVTVEHNNTQYSIPNYNKLQRLADNGALIIGVRKNENKNGHYSSGHIVMLLPFDESEGNENGRGSMDTNSDITIDYPYAMECGGNYKDQDWLDTESFLNMKWYIYK
jgi:hypothetical protein